MNERLISRRFFLIFYSVGEFLQNSFLSFETLVLAANEMNSFEPFYEEKVHFMLAPDSLKMLDPTWSY